MEKRRHRINLFDIVIFAVIIIAAVIGYRYLNREKVVGTSKLRYTIELRDNPDGFSNNIHIGDDITDNVKNYYMGKVVDVKVEPCKKLIADTVDGAVKESECEGKETDILTLEADVTDDGANYRVNGYYTVKAGLEVAAKGNGYAGRGYILTVDR
ncbi:MAG: DUF4330 domain-containing protein [Clostridia bacterium]|jgi:hypothetical protein|nr:DUF4330 domain-containing protein [Clostridia bacterium]